MSEQPKQQPRKEITAQEFIDIVEGLYRKSYNYSHYYKLENGKNIISITGHKITGNVIINQISEANIRIANTEFTGIIVFNNANINLLQFDNCEAKSISIGANSTLRDFRIESSKVKDVSCQEVTLSNISIADSKTNNINLSKSKIRYLFIWSSNTWDIQLKDNTIVEDSCDISGSITGHINIVSSKINSYLCIKENSVIGNLNIISDSFIEQLWAYDKPTIGRVHYKNSTITKSLFSEGTSIAELNIDYVNIQCKTLVLHSVYVDIMRIDIDSPYKISVLGDSKRNSKIRRLEFSNTVFPKDALLSVSNSSINDIYFDAFINRGLIVLNNISPLTAYKEFIQDDFNNPARKEDRTYELADVKNDRSIIDISDSDLGNTQFIGCDLDMFDFEFSNSKILDVFLADTFLPTKEQINRDWIIEGENEQRRLALSQFKKIYEQQGDAVRAAQLRAEEMEVYRNQLRDDDDSDFSSSDWWNNKAERLNLWMNRHSNYYGSNWLRAVVVTLGVTWFFFSAYCWSIGYHFGKDYEKFFELFSYSFEFLNPIRRHSTLATEHDISPLARVIDYIGRIFIAYMVYQTIAAFRKFGKKT